MNIDSYFPSKFIKASDLDEAPLVLRISGVETEKMSDGAEKPVLYFSNSPKGLVLNKTNASVVKELYGPDTDAWEGKLVKLIASTTDFGGKTVDCIRLRPPAQHKKPRPADFGDLDDEIPY